MLTPKIEFSHVLAELSVNRNDPCELLRELISNSYDAGAKHIFYAPLEDNNGIVFFDDGSGLSSSIQRNGITPWEAFFSIGKSTKHKGEGIGYKCQGSKLCFASSRVLVATKTNGDSRWHYIVLDNPRMNLNVSTDLSPSYADTVGDIIALISPNPSLRATKVFNKTSFRLEKISSGTLILIDGLDTEDFSRHFAFSGKIEESYLYNYVRFSTCHGDVRRIDKKQGFTANHLQLVAGKAHPRNFAVFCDDDFQAIPFGFPYLATDEADQSVKSPAQVARLRDGRFFSRSAKSFTVGSSKFSITFAIDGNRRAHDEYKYLDRKGAAKSGVRLSDQRGIFVSVKGIKICRYPDAIWRLPKFRVLAEGDSVNHYILVIDGDFDLVTNRNALSKKAFDLLDQDSFSKELEKFLEYQLKQDAVFSELLARLKRESSEMLLNEQISILDRSKERVRTRERFRIKDAEGKSQLFLSPLPGEEYLVGVLYAVLSGYVTPGSGMKNFWKKIITFSTQGIDSLALRDVNSAQPLADANISAVEYKYEFSNAGPFNHALAVTDFIVAWNVQVDIGKRIDDSYTVSGDVSADPKHAFVWKITNLEDVNGAVYDHDVTVIDLRGLIAATFPEAKFVVV